MKKATAMQASGSRLDARRIQRVRARSWRTSGTVSGTSGSSCRRTRGATAGRGGGGAGRECDRSGEGAAGDRGALIAEYRASADPRTVAAVKWQRPVGPSSLHRIKETLREVLRPFVDQALLTHNVAKPVEPGGGQPDRAVRVGDRAEQVEAPVVRGDRRPRPGHRLGHARAPGSPLRGQSPTESKATRSSPSRTAARCTRPTSRTSSPG